MANLTRKLQKIFAGNATNNGQFGSLRLEAKVLDNDPDIIQALPAFINGWNDATSSGEELPSLEEMQSLHFLTTRQISYLLNKGAPEWNVEEEYFIGDIQREIGGTKIYKSITDNNIGNSLTDISNWQLLVDLSTISDISTTTSFGRSVLPKQVIISNGTDVDHDIDSTAGNFMFSDGSGQAVINSFTKQTDANFTLGTNVGGMPATVNKTGTYATTGTSVAGVGTSFDIEFTVGDILWSTTKGEGRRILSIAGPASMTLVAAFSTDVTAGEVVQKNGLAPNSTYHYFQLSKSDGSLTDLGFDTNVNAVNLLADSIVSSASLTKYKRVGSIITDVNANILPFIMTPIDNNSASFMFNSKILEFSGITPPIGTSLTVTSPIGIKTGALFSGNINHLGSSCFYLLKSKIQGDYMFVGGIGNVNLSRSSITPPFPILTNTNSEIEHGYDPALATAVIDLYLHGWIDYNIF